MSGGDGKTQRLWALLAVLLRSQERYSGVNRRRVTLTGGRSREFGQDAESLGPGEQRLPAHPYGVDPFRRFTIWQTREAVSTARKRKMTARSKNIPSSRPRVSPKRHREDFEAKGSKNEVFLIC